MHFPDPSGQAAETGTHALPIRVYYEDTDAAGVAYYASYWRFCERARTEWLRDAGFEQQALMEREGLAFVVRTVHGDYLKPARLDDRLTVHTGVKGLRRASLDFAQKIVRGTELLFSATVTVACLDMRRQRPAAIPTDLHRTLATLA